MEIRPDLPEQEPLPPDKERIRQQEQAPVTLTPATLAPNGPLHLPVTWWWLVSALAMGLVFAIGGMVLFRSMARPLGLLVLAITIAAALSPIVVALTRFIPRTVAVILIYIVLVLILVGVFSATLPLLVAQIKALGKESSVLLPKITQGLGQFGLDPAQINNSFGSALSGLGSIAFTLPVNLLHGLFEVGLVIFLSLYWLLLMPQLMQFALSFFRFDQRGRVAHILGETGRAMGGYLRGAAINGLIIGALKYAGLLVIGVPYALTLGALAGVLELFPTIGPIIAGSLATLVALSVSPQTALITAAYAIVLQQTEGHILVPLIMRSQTNISPLLAIFAVVAGAAVGGLLGAIIAIPVASALHVFVHLVLAPIIRRANGVVAEEV